MVQREIGMISRLFLRKKGESKMEFYMKLPRSKKEFALFMGMVSIISVNIIAPLITFLKPVSTCMFIGMPIVLPLIWLSVIVVVLLTYIPAEKDDGKNCFERRQF